MYHSYKFDELFRIIVCTNSTLAFILCSFYTTRGVHSPSKYCSSLRYLNELNCNSLLKPCIFCSYCPASSLRCGSHVSKTSLQSPTSLHIVPPDNLSILVRRCIYKLTTVVPSHLLLFKLFPIKSSRTLHCHAQSVTSSLQLSPFQRLRKNHFLI